MTELTSFGGQRWNSGACHHCARYVLPYAGRLELRHGAFAERNTICRVVIQVTDRNRWLLYMEPIWYGGSHALRLNRYAGRAGEMAMIRWTDLIGVAGFAMVVLSTLLLFPDSEEHMNWRYWLAGLSVWSLGFASVFGWLLLRWSVRQSKDEPPPLLVWSARQSQEKNVTSRAGASDLHSKKTA